MHFFGSLAAGMALTGVGLVHGQYGAYGGGGSDATTAATSATAAAASAGAAAPTAASSSGGQVSVHVVKVSNAQGTLAFTPAQVQANPGDMVQYQFYPKNHSVVQSNFDNPCVPLSESTPGSQGFFSGFMPVSLGQSMMPTFTVRVPDTKPIWFYCSQATHCESGMVGVINPPANNQSRTLDAFKALAASAPQNISPNCSSSAVPAAPTSAPSTLATSASPAAAEPSSTVPPPSTSTSASPQQVTSNPAARIALGGHVEQFAAAGLVAFIMGVFL
ncbi:MAG: hypothetical protein M1838_005850 [Thelocarpon superellum]|nr:MAG: hypothetical protein M1838_005850 [Thelocarpon superellum]